MILRRLVPYLTVLFLIAAPVVGQSDWTMARFDEGQSGFTPEQIETPLSIAWQYSTAEFRDNRSTPAIAGGVAYFSSGNVLWAVESTTGSLKWRYPSSDTLKAYIKTGIAFSGGLVLFGASDGGLYAISAIDGRIAWTFPTKGTIRSTPVVSGGVVYFGSDDNSLYAVDLKTGESVWAGGFRTGDDIQASPAVSPGVVIFISMDANVYGASPATGKLRWSYRLPLSPVKMQPVVSGNLAFIGCGGSIHVLSAKTGQLRYTINLPSDLTAPPAVAGNDIFVTCRNKKLYSFTVGQAAPKAKWTEPATVGVISYNSPTIAGDKVFVTTRRGTVAAFSAETGRQIWRYVCSPSQIGMTNNIRQEFVDISTPAAVSNGAVYVLADDGALRCFKAGAADNTPPRVYNVIPDPGTVASGLPPILISALLYDEGTGIDPESVKVLIDDDAVDSKFDPATLMVSYQTPLTTPTQKLDDGRHDLAILAKDWKGNDLGFRWSFIADNSLPPRKLPKKATPTTPTKPGTGGKTTPTPPRAPGSGPPAPPSGGPAAPVITTSRTIVAPVD